MVALGPPATRRPSAGTSGAVAWLGGDAGAGTGTAPGSGDGAGDAGAAGVLVCAHHPCCVGATAPAGVPTASTANPHTPPATAATATTAATRPPRTPVHHRRPRIRSRTPSGTTWAVIGPLRHRPQ